MKDINIMEDNKKYIYEVKGIKVIGDNLPQTVFQQYFLNESEAFMVLNHLKKSSSSAQYSLTIHERS